MQLSDADLTVTSNLPKLPVDQTAKFIGHTQCL